MSVSSDLLTFGRNTVIRNGDQFAGFFWGWSREFYSVGSGTLEESRKVDEFN